MSYEDYPPIKAEVTIKRHESPLIQTGYEEREGGLLIVDENDTVYDLTLFGFDSDPYADHLFGLVRLVGARQIVLDRLNKYNEEVLTDTRDGFNRRHPFYAALAAKLEPLLEPLVEEERRLRRSGQEELPPEVKRKHMQAFQKLNQLYRKITEQTELIGVDPMLRDTLPRDGIEFARPDITTTEGKRYSILLRIDTQAIAPSSTVFINSSNQYIGAGPSTVVVEEPKTEGRVDCKSVSLQGDLAGEVGIVSAQVDGHRAEVLVTVVPEEIFIPPHGLDFFPDFFYAHQGKRSFLNLYADLSKVEAQATIELAADNPAVQLEMATLGLAEGTIHGEKVARLRIPFTGYGVGERARVSATCGSLEAVASVSVISGREQPPPGRQGKFSGYRFDRLARRFQTTYDPTSGEIIVNTEHPINKMYFGDEPSRAVQTLPHCQILLAELVLSECLNVMVSQAIYEGPLERRYPNNPEIDIQNYVLDNKLLIGKEIHDIFVDEQLLRTSIETMAKVEEEYAGG